MKYIHILTITIILLMSGTASAWLSDYDHRMPITVNNGGVSTLNYYQFNFTNDTNTLVAAGHMLSSGADCRVTDHLDNLIPFWNETAFNAAGTKIYANATTLAVGSNMFYMYYGNAGASSVANITTTFMFGDDFDGGADPVKSNFGDWSACRASYIVGDTAYVTERNGLHAVNISDKSNPVLRGFVSLGTGSIDDGSLDVNVIGNYAFVSVRSNHKLSVVDISNPDNLVEVGNVIDATYLYDNHGIYALGDYVYCCPYCKAALGYLTIVNVSNKANPTIEGHVAHTTALKGVHDVVVDGNYAYVASHFSGSSGSNGTVTIVDVSNKASPSVVSYIDSTDLYAAADIQKSGNYVYTGCSNSIVADRWIASIDVSDVNNPSIADRLTGYGAYIGAIHGNYFYGADGYCAINTVDISTPTALSLVKQYSFLASDCNHVFLTADGAYLIVSRWQQSPATDKFYIINRSDMLASGDGIDSDKWNIAGATGSWILDNDTLKASGSGTSCMISTYSVPSAYIFEMKTKKPDDRNSYGYPKYVDTGNFVGGTLAGTGHAYRDFTVKEGGSETTFDRDNVAWSLNTWYRWKLVDNSGIYNFTTEKLDGSDSHTMNNVDSVGFTGNLVLAIYDGDGYFDDVRVRKYASPEPTSSLGVEEDASSAEVSYMPPNPISLMNTTGNFWVNHTWSVGSGNVTDSYNVSVNNIWYNTTTDTFYNDTYTAHAWQNITVYAFNTSDMGTLSAGSINQNTQIPNNPITITNTSDWSGDAGETVYVDYDATDADSDTATFSCDRTDLFTDFDTSTGIGNWTATANIYYVDFGVSDGYGSSSNYTMTLIESSVEITLLDELKLIMSEITIGLKSINMGNYLVYAFILIGILLIILLIQILNNCIYRG